METQQTSTPGFVRDWIDAWSAHDGARLAALYADDGVYQDIPNGLIVRGVEIEGLVAGFAGMVDGLSYELSNAAASAGRAFAEWTLSGRNASMIPGDGTRDKQLSVRGTTIFQLDTDGKIVHSSDYYDLATAMRQAGALPSGDQG